MRDQILSLGREGSRVSLTIEAKVMVKAHRTGETKTATNRCDKLTPKSWQALSSLPQSRHYLIINKLQCLAIATTALVWRCVSMFISWSPFAEPVRDHFCSITKREVLFRLKSWQDYLLIWLNRLDNRSSCDAWHHPSTIWRDSTYSAGDIFIED